MSNKYWVRFDRYGGGYAVVTDEQHVDYFENKAAAQDLANALNAEEDKKSRKHNIILASVFILIVLIIWITSS